MFYFLISRVNLKGSRYTEDILPSLKMTVSDTNVENGVLLKLKVLLLLSHLPRLVLHCFNVCQETLVLRFA